MTTSPRESTVSTTDFIGANYDYPEASYAERERIVADHVSYQQGLLWTLANHPRVPPKVRAEFQQLGLAAGIAPADVPLDVAVQAAGQHLAADAAAELGDLLRTLVHQHHVQGDLRIVCGDRIGDLLEQNRLATARRRDDEGPLPFA